MLERIRQNLAQVETEHNCRVLYACESGSRAWGFASPDSDYDVRFVYVPAAAWYFTLDTTRDTIEAMLPDDVDLAGWELLKTLRLFATCNLALNEWLDSPVVYSDPHGFRQHLAARIPDFFNPRKAVFHYLSIAAQSLELRQPDGAISIKKLFYVLRPLLAGLWIERSRQMPPTDFHTMLNDPGLLPADIAAQIRQIHLLKQTAVEKQAFTIPPGLNAWIDQTRQHLEAIALKLPVSPGIPRSDLNQTLHHYLRLTPQPFDFGQ
jgi:predicted nucleotidyltransferase